jgi:hypothetical protein
MAVTKNNNKKVTYAGNNVDRKGAHTQWECKGWQGTEVESRWRSVVRYDQSM